MDFGGKLCWCVISNVTSDFIAVMFAYAKTTFTILLFGNSVT